MTRVVVLGATGSVGRSTLEVVRRHPGRFRIVGLAARRAVAELEALAAETDVRRVAVADPDGPSPGGPIWCARGGGAAPGA